MSAEMLILNDVHIGFDRKAGTTPASQEAMRGYLLTSFEEAVVGAQRKHILVAGDLFDSFEVPTRDLLRAFLVLEDHLVSGGTLTLMAGNHDWSPKGSRMSSFEALGRILHETHGDDRVQVVGIDQVATVMGHDNVHVIAHCSSQTDFEGRLHDVLVDIKKDEYLVLHCNYDNVYAAKSEQSLNLTVEVARAFTDLGATILIAHEHQAKQAFNGRVQVLGNQWPTSIADCLGNDEKYAHTIGTDGLRRTDPTWKHDAEASYNQVPWDMLASYSMSGANASFIRVFGEATAAQAGDVISEIAAFRARSSAFIISNAVKVDGIIEVEELPKQFEVAKQFDVMSYIEQHLEPTEMVVVNKLLEEA